MNPQFKAGDIVRSIVAIDIVILEASEQKQAYYGFDSNRTYIIPYKDESIYTKVGEFPLHAIDETIVKAKESYMDLQTQVNIAVQLLDTTVKADGKPTLYIRSEIYVDKNKSTVYVKYSDCTISILDLCKDYGVNKNGI